MPCRAPRPQCASMLRECCDPLVWSGSRSQDVQRMPTKACPGSFHEDMSSTLLQNSRDAVLTVPGKEQPWSRLEGPVLGALLAAQKPTTKAPCAIHLPERWHVATRRICHRYQSMEARSIVRARVQALITSACAEARSWDIMYILVGQ